MAVLLDHIHPSFCFLTTAPSKGLYLPQPRFATVTAVAPVTSGNIGISLSFPIFAFPMVFSFPGKCNFSELTLRNHQRQMFAQRFPMQWYSPGRTEGTENSLTIGETSLPGRYPETGWSGTGLPRPSSSLESPSPCAFVEMQHPHCLV